MDRGAPTHDPTRRVALQALAGLAGSALPAPARASGADGGDVASRLAAATPASQRARARRLLAAHAHLSPRDETGLRQRVLAISAALLNAPFAWNPIGEGPQAWDSDPPLQLARFDCLTFVEAVLGLARAATLDELYDDLAALRYGWREPSFEHRHHFVSTEWLPAAVAGGIVCEAALPIPAAAAPGCHEVRIDRRGWFARLAVNPMYRGWWQRAPLPLHADADAPASLPYLPRVLLLAALPPAASRSMLAGAVVAVLRPGTPFAREVGGNDPISHLGLLVHGTGSQRGRWLLRGTSVTARTVIDRPLAAALAGVGRLPPALGCLLLRVCPRGALTAPAQPFDCGQLHDARRDRN